MVFKIDGVYMEKKYRDWQDSVIIGIIVGGSILIGLILARGFQISSNISNQLPSPLSSISTAVAQPQSDVQSSSLKQSQIVIAPILVQTKRVNFATESVGAVIRDSLGSNQLIRYVLWCGKSQQMRIKVTEGSININIISPDGQPIGKGSDQWQGILQSDGDYTIEIRSSGLSTFQFNVEVL